MAIITLTTDLGTADHYLAEIKGKLLCLNLDLQIIDISHHIEKHNIFACAYLFQNAYRHFPEKTIHLLSVDSGTSDSMGYVLVEYQNHYFIGPDNGLFSLIFDPKKIKVYSLNAYNTIVSYFPISDIYIQVVKDILLQKHFESIGEEIKLSKLSTPIQAVITNQRIDGSYIYFDDFGNAVTNIKKEEFEHAVGKKSFEIHLARKTSINTISAYYGKAHEGELLAHFNSHKYLEIASNKGSAKELLGLTYDTPFFIEIHE
jgi:S-adenosyl-L-methionine hydrolase (adenosine-forming)